jgi:hypothetical protein
MTQRSFLIFSSQGRGCKPVHLQTSQDARVYTVTLEWNIRNQTSDVGNLQSNVLNRVTPLRIYISIQTFILRVRRNFRGLLFCFICVYLRPSAVKKMF